MKASRDNDEPSSVLGPFARGSQVMDFNAAMPRNQPDFQSLCMLADVAYRSEHPEEHAGFSDDEDRLVIDEADEEAPATQTAVEVEAATVEERPLDLSVPRKTSSPTVENGRLDAILKRVIEDDFEYVNAEDEPLDLSRKSSAAAGSFSYPKPASAFSYLKPASAYPKPAALPLPLPLPPPKPRTFGLPPPKPPSLLQSPTEETFVSVTVPRKPWSVVPPIFSPGERIASRAEAFSTAMPPPPGCPFEAIEYAKRAPLAFDRSKRRATARSHPRSAILSGQVPDEPLKLTAPYSTTVGGKGSSKMPPCFDNSDNMLDRIYTLYYNGRKHEVPWVMLNGMTLADAIARINAGERGCDMPYNRLATSWFRCEPLVPVDDPSMPEEKRTRRYCSGNIDLAACPSAWANYTEVPADDPIWKVVKTSATESRRTFKYTQGFLVYLTVNMAENRGEYKPLTFGLYGASYRGQQIRSWVRYKLDGQWRFYGDPYCLDTVAKDCIFGLGEVIYGRRYLDQQSLDLCSVYTKYALKMFGGKLGHATNGVDPSYLPGLGDMDHLWGWHRPCAKDLVSGKYWLPDRPEARDLDKEETPKVACVRGGSVPLDVLLMESERPSNTQKLGQARHPAGGIHTAPHGSDRAVVRVPEYRALVGPSVVQLQAPHHTAGSGSGSGSSNTSTAGGSLPLRFVVNDVHQRKIVVRVSQHAVDRFTKSGVVLASTANVGNHLNVHAKRQSPGPADDGRESKKVRLGGALVPGADHGQPGAHAQTAAAHHQVRVSGVEQSLVPEPPRVSVKELGSEDAPVVIGGLRVGHGGETSGERTVEGHPSHDAAAHDF